MSDTVLQEAENRRKTRADQVQVVPFGPRIPSRIAVPQIRVAVKPTDEEARETARMIREAEESARKRHLESIASKWNAPARQVSRQNICRTGKFAAWAAREKQLAEKLGSGFIYALVGIRGGGKTQLGVELMRNRQQRLTPSYYLTALRLFEELKEAQSDKRVSKLLDRLKNWPLLVIDEAGQRGETEFENRMLAEIVNSRYSAQNDTLFLSNQTPEQFEAAMDPAIISRMNECGGVIDCDWSSFRD